MKTRFEVALLGGLLASALVACGGHDPGGGTQTLWVRAQAETDGSTSGSWFVVQVRDGSENGTLLNDAVVSIEGDNTGELVLPFDGGDFFGFRVGANIKRDLPWDTGWRLTVRRGKDELDAYLEAPGVTTITAPVGGTTFRRSNGENLVVEWKDEKGRRADVVEVDFRRADDADRTFGEDPREYEVDFNRLRAADDERIEVRRRNEVNLEGGVPGSRLTATTKHRIDLTVE